MIAGIGWELVAKTLETMGRPMPDFSRADMTRHWEHQIPLDPVIFAAIVVRELLAAGVTIKYHTMLGALSGEESGWAVTPLRPGRAVRSEKQGRGRLQRRRQRRKAGRV